MKRAIAFLLVLFFSLSLSTVQHSYASRDMDCLVAADIQFKVINDTNAEFIYFVNDEKNVIQKGQSVGFSYAENTVVYHWVNGQKGNAWFTVSADMHGKSFQLSSLLSNQ
ncbi:MAG: hypothetical protein IAE67_08145 [Candidatus Competibacteraceae bacterium]|nr:hypothetical protein [Candidatus Competibacteraceae bacterium]